MTTYLTWLHISDLHFCAPWTAWRSDRLLASLAADLAALESKHGLRPDLVFVTGDVAFGQIRDVSGLCMADQYENAWLFLVGLLDIYKPALPLENLFIVPGNHDVDRSKARQPINDWLSTVSARRVTEMIRDADPDWQLIAERQHAYLKFLNDLGATHLLADPKRLIFDAVREIAGLKVGIAGFNSAWSCKGDKEKGQLWMGAEWQLHTLEHRLEKADLRIALMHHPASWFVEREDPSLAQWLTARFHICAHGHEHDGWVARDDNHLRIAAGAAYGDSDHETGYNIVRLDPKTGTVEVWLREYTKKGIGAWKPMVIPKRTDDLGYAVYPGQLRLPTIVPVPASPAAAPPTAPPTPITVPASPVPQPGLEGPESRGIHGRGPAINALQGRLNKKSVVVLYGMTGIGKTMIAVELARRLGFIDTVRFIVTSRNWTMMDVFAQMARLFDDQYERKLSDVRGRRDWSILDGARPGFVLIENAHLLFNDHRTTDSELADLLREFAARAPQVKLILESSEEPPTGLCDVAGVGKQMVVGLPREALAALLRRPEPSDPGLGWDLSERDLDYVFNRLGDSINRGAHPFAARLLVAVASHHRETPRQVLEHRVGELNERIEKRLFTELFVNILSPTQRRALHFCALYRAGIPEAHHLIAINDAVKDEFACQVLERHCLLAHQDQTLYLHNIIRDLTMVREGGGDNAEMHEVLGDAWLETVRHLPKRNPSQLRAAAEAVHHLLAAGRYDRLPRLATVLRHSNDLLNELRETSLRLNKSGHHTGNRCVLEILVALEPDVPTHRRFLGECIARLDGKNSPNALEQFLVAHRLSPERPENLANVGRTYLARGEAALFVQLVDDLPPAIQKQAINDHVACILANVREDLGQHDQASLLRRRLIDDGSRNPVLFNDEAKALLRLGRPQEALDILDKAAQGASNAYTASIRGTRSRPSASTTRPSCSGVASSTRAPAIPCYSMMRPRRSYVSAGPRRPLDILDKADAQGASDAYTANIRGAVLDALGQHDQASLLRRRLIDEGSRDPVLFNDEAMALLRLGRAQEALDILDKADAQGASGAYTANIRRAVLEALGRND
ncbi:metallophosphoesterase [Nannocystis sp.]|uniref:metallophosphoesterase n=1 Tax=Nannocystis sp. TaxID=1962667 RepID=UPI0025E42AB0|nr:metallophosphoesterase [Nannocystis sp.]MBK7829236.1 metallophosphoesterase [Nannocystis sp.]